MPCSPHRVDQGLPHTLLCCLGWGSACSKPRTPHLENGQPSLEKPSRGDTGLSFATQQGPHSSRSRTARLHYRARGPWSCSQKGHGRIYSFLSLLRKESPPSPRRLSGGTVHSGFFPTGVVCDKSPLCLCPHPPKGTLTDVTAETRPRGPEGITYASPERP